MIAPEAVVTFERPDGFTVLKSFGLARGEAVCPRNLLRATFRSIGAFIGFAPIDYLTDAERARSDCLTELLQNATRLGANGIVGLHFEADEQGDGSTRVLAIGEAVLLDPQPRAIEALEQRT
jgi:uncharacterized protein YbjQ (UPF0145 family)